MEPVWLVLIRRRKPGRGGEKYVGRYEDCHTGSGRCQTPSLSSDFQVCIMGILCNL